METRKEQIEKVSEKWAESASDGLYYDKGPLKRCRKGGFVAGAKWADEHPREGLVDIEKVCEWWSEVPDDTYGFNPCRIYMDDFRKAMGVLGSGDGGTR